MLSVRCVPRMIIITQHRTFANGDCSYPVLSVHCVLIVAIVIQRRTRLVCQQWRYSSVNVSHLSVLLLIRLPIFFDRSLIIFTRIFRCNTFN